MSRHFIGAGNDSGDGRGPGLTEAPGVHALSYDFDHHDEITALMAQEEQTPVDFSGS